MSISNLKVMHSNAGYYIGRSDESGSPYSRESGYYKSYTAAEEALKTEFEIRDCVENNSAYANGLLPDIRKSATHEELDDKEMCVCPNCKNIFLVPFEGLLEITCPDCGHHEILTAD